MTRLTLRFSDRAIKRLEEIAKSAGAESTGETVRTALLLYDSLLMAGLRFGDEIFLLRQGALYSAFSYEPPEGQPTHPEVIDLDHYRRRKRK